MIGAEAALLELERGGGVAQRSLVVALALAQQRAVGVERAGELVLARQPPDQRLGHLGPAIAVFVARLPLADGLDQIDGGARGDLVVMAGQRRGEGAMERARGVGVVAVIAEQLAELAAAPRPRRADSAAWRRRPAPAASDAAPRRSARPGRARRRGPACDAPPRRDAALSDRAAARSARAARRRRRTARGRQRLRPTAPRARPSPRRRRRRARTASRAAQPIVEAGHAQVEQLLRLLAAHAASPRRRRCASSTQARA